MLTEPSTPKISVVIPLYNKEKEITRAIGSVFEQTMKDFEVIIINDGSTDRSCEIVASYAGQLGWEGRNRIRIIDQVNQGVSAARNRGIEEGKSDLIAFLDADDEWLPRYLETILRLWASFPECDVFSTNYLFVEPEGKGYVPALRGVPGKPWEGILTNYFAVAAKSDPPLWSSAVSVTKKAITSVKGFPVGVTSGEDLLTWAKLAASYDIAYSTIPLAKFNMCLEVRPRLPQVPDIVGEGMIDLLKNETDRSIRIHLKEYVAVWYKMRANCYLRLGKHKMAFVEALKALRYNPKSSRLYAYVFLALFPFNYSRLLIGIQKGVRGLRNNDRKRTCGGAG